MMASMRLHVPTIETAGSMTRPALAGAAAAAIWAAAEPALGRAFGTPYTDVELLGGFVTRGRLRRPVGLALHCAFGAAFGVAFARAGGAGVRQGVLAAQAEGLALWPGMAVIDRVHPFVRDGSWPPLFRNGRVFAQEAAAHALFGALLGLCTDNRT
jgi:hypothetical protein